ncbi:SIS domain-containing protein [Gammaproteobacteria bacterium]|jgi:phosphoheptose isomerase|nr:SIS domain-containing protein [Gammaproteobacteria bacterium]|tara:strand:- start:447 stop:1049 length:603 start_codon:yes stop_codon:yes gene_type:complete
MKDDPRVNNNFFNNDSISSYLKDYSNDLNRAINSVSISELENALNTLKEYSSTNKDILTIGNGGSHAIADHLACDFTKGTYKDENQRLKVIPLGSLAAMHSAAANDFGHQHAFSQQLKFLGSKESLLIAISSSGKSENIINAVRYHQDQGGKCIAMTGFDGGDLGKISDVSLHVSSSNYGIIEDTHQSLVHILAQYLYLI